QSSTRQRIDRRTDDMDLPFERPAWNCGKSNRYRVAFLQQSNLVLIEARPKPQTRQVEHAHQLVSTLDAHSNLHGRIADDAINPGANQEIVSRQTGTLKFRNLFRINFQEFQTTTRDINYLIHRPRGSAAVFPDLEKIDQFLLRRTQILATDDHERLSRCD